MDEKMFGLLEKMYIKMQEMESNMVTKKELKEIGSKMQQGFVRLKNKMEENHKALYDGYRQSIEGINETREKLEKLTDKVENQEIKLQVLKSAK